jgi:hypothetical protein
LIPEQAVHAPFIQAALRREVVCLMFVAIHRVIFTVTEGGERDRNRLTSFALPIMSCTGKYRVYRIRHA